jgi:hypothetical protein
MELMKGDLFVVTKGYKLGSLRGFDFFDDGGPSTATEVQQTDRSQQGCVFEVMEMCGPVIACKCIFYDGEPSPSPTSKFYSKEGGVHSFNTMEIEIWPITKVYLESLLQARKNHA